MLIGILKNQNPDSVIKWELACQKKNVDYKVIDLVKNTWLEEIKTKQYNLFLTRPPGDISNFKRLYDERLYIISKELGLKIFPTYEECLIYENKVLLSYFLGANNIPHPKTNVFYNYEEALSYINETTCPFVAKSSIGGAGSGIKIVQKKDQAIKYIKKAFKGSGIRRRFGPNRVTGSPSKWFVKALQDPLYFKNKVISYFERHKDTQYGFVIFQEYIPHDFEWRIVKIGESYFAYKKFRIKDMASGSKSLGFENPPLDMLDFVRIVSNQNQIHCAAFDLFSNADNYLINEIQTLFGHIHNHILEVDGKPGRYLHQNGQWVFEEGDFNTNESYDLRLKTAIELYEKG
jgi:glutathione synthase/RimK-type ligase-like ATP-grasp enzyme